MDALGLSFRFPEGAKLDDREKMLILNENSQAARKMGYSVRVTENTLSIVEENIKMECDGDASNVNFMWNFSPEQMILTGAERIFENARMPLPEKAIDKWDNISRWRNGECYLTGVDRIKFEFILICLPTKEKVMLELEIPEKGDKDAYRQSFLDMLWRVEKSIKLTRSTIQLIQAFRTEPKNDGFVQRSIREMFAAIGNVL